MKEHDLNLRDFVLDEIESIECIGDMPTVDISVRDTHMFFANDIYTHNSSHEEEVVGALNVADSYKKIMIGDFIMSLSRMTQDKIAGTGRVMIIKSRFGSDGNIYPCKFDASCGDIGIYDEKSVEGMELIKKAKSATENIRDILRKKWKGTHGDGNDAS